jgi:hypothetical protein
VFAQTQPDRYVGRLARVPYPFGQNLQQFQPLSFRRSV